MSDFDRLSELTEQWVAMPRGTGEEKDAAEDFYADRVFPDSIEHVVGNSRPAFEQTPYDLAVLTLGHSPYPIVFSILALAPRKAVLLHSADTKKYLKPIQDWVREADTIVVPHPVDENNPLTVYEAIRKELGSSVQQQVAVDITGGTKAMVGGASLAASVLGADLVYVGNTEFLDKLRRPRPGSELVKLLPDPLEVFGDLTEMQALELASQHQYSRAADKLDELIDDVSSMHVSYDLERSVMHGYAHLEALDFEEGAKCLQAAAKSIGNCLEQGAQVRFCAAHHEAIATQAELARIAGDALAADAPVDLLVDDDAFQAVWSFVYNFGLRREDCKQLDMAALCMYRCLELIPQRRFAAAYDVDTSQPDYDKLPLSKNDPLTALEKQAPNNTPGEELPDDIDCMNGLKILVAINDDLASSSVKEMESLLKKTRGVMKARNNSIFAHGLSKLKKKDYDSFRGTVEEWAEHLCATEGWEFDELKNNFKFIDFSPLNTSHNHSDGRGS